MLEEWMRLERDVVPLCGLLDGGPSGGLGVDCDEGETFPGVGLNWWGSGLDLEVMGCLCMGGLLDGGPRVGEGCIWR